MVRLSEVEISRTIIQTYHQRLLDCLTSDVAIAGAGPSGLVAAYCLAKAGLKVTILEKRLSPGGGIWGGGMGMNIAVVQEEAVSVLSEMRNPLQAGTKRAVRRGRDRTRGWPMLERGPSGCNTAKSDDCGGLVCLGRTSHGSRCQSHHDRGRSSGRSNCPISQSRFGRDWPRGRAGPIHEETSPSD